jgi:hypothetical protein
MIGQVVCETRGSGFHRPDQEHFRRKSHLQLEFLGTRWMGIDPRKPTNDVVAGPPRMITSRRPKVFSGAELTETAPDTSLERN